MIHFTDERTADIPAREALLDRAMGKARLLKPSERLRRGRLPAAGLALVAWEHGNVVGTVRLWNVNAGDAPALLLGPLAVDPTAQGEGIGSGLMQLALARAADLGHGGVILVGDPEYYARFGFTAALTGGLVMPAPVDRRRFLGIELTPAALVEVAGPVTAAVTTQDSRLRLAA
jgi:predicted N-acetyltransferase YhbS